ncbi:MAG TPA: substrate-binding domain-containing protein [Anaerolineales bacterium]
MKANLPFILLSCLLLSSCSNTTLTPTAEIINIQYTSAAEPWLAALYSCAGNTVVTADLRAADFLDLQATDLVIRFGQPENLTSSAYRIGTDDLLVIVNPQNPVKKLDASQARGLFSGQIQNWKDAGGSDSLAQVWAFSKADDLQAIFNQIVLGSSPVTSTARLAASTDEMIQAVSRDVNAIGILTGHLKTSSVSEVFTVTNVPVLILTRSDPPGEITSIISCLQK